MRQGFEVGDVVRLKSGGGLMVIQAIRGEGDDHAECVWHEIGSPHMAIYIFTVLVRE